MRKLIHEDIKRSIHSFLPGANVILFGSRARGEASVSSDVDLLIVTDQDLDSKSKLGYEKNIRKQLTHDFETPFDIILQTRNEWAEKKLLLGHIVYYATKEGITL
ncbi:MAG: nucleotidyltransferase domain-containing protein [Sediminibacterium sp.]|uniref:nucleotidyltransferase domain-containing protein n=1 Tax=Sediminibacterium sp. TaxID=1917865 RepID=UPI002ABC331C|nr:nucleotidyltransferase domain-containing protein [Sediminibacterium sp.]MDZ4070997.1 nucleotidyltransferase domain-containing protein [Sediminibacterium sp.]